MIYNVTSASYDSERILLPHEATKYFSEKLDLVWQNIKVSHSLFYKDWESMCPTYDIKGKVCVGEEKAICPYKIKINYCNGANSESPGFYINLYHFIPKTEPLIASFYFSVVGGYLSPAEWGKIKSDVLDKLQEKFQEREKRFKSNSLIDKIKKGLVSYRFPIYIFMIGLIFIEACKYIGLI